MDPWQLALDAIFNGPGSIAAMYQRGAGWSQPVRVIKSSPDQDAPFGQSRIIQATNLFEIRRSEVAQPAVGDQLAIDFVIYEIIAEPFLDTEGLTWTVGASPKP